MAGKGEYRIFVGGLSWNVTESQLEDGFARFGKIVEAQVLFPTTVFCVASFP